MVRAFVKRNPMTVKAFSLITSFAVALAFNTSWPFLLVVLIVLLTLV